MDSPPLVCIALEKTLMHMHMWSKRTNGSTGLTNMKQKHNLPAYLPSEKSLFPGLGIGIISNSKRGLDAGFFG